MATNGEKVTKFGQIYIPLSQVLTTIIALTTFWITFGNHLEAKLNPIQKDIQIIREAIVQHHGQIPR